MEHFYNRRPEWYSRLLRKNLFLRIPCADHTKFTKDGCVVLEPYTRGKEDFKALISFCDKNNLDFMVSGESIHYPGHTFSIRIFEAKPKDLNLDYEKQIKKIRANLEKSH